MSRSILFSIGVVKFAKLIHSFKENNYKGCSRTDHGVNAISNIFFINCIKKPNLSQLNYYLPKDITIWSFIQISSNFNPRKAIHKKYRYYLPKTLIKDPNQLDKLQDYLGTHDFTAFIKKSKFSFYLNGPQVEPSYERIHMIADICYS